MRRHVSSHVLPSRASAGGQARHQLELAHWRHPVGFTGYKYGLQSYKDTKETSGHRSGFHDRAPRATKQDFEFTLAESEKGAIPGAHPLPLTSRQMERMAGFPLVSPFLPSPNRQHPYFTTPPPEWPHFTPTTPIVYTSGTMKTPIILPVHSIENDGAVSHTRAMDPFIFGQYPASRPLAWQNHYWLVRCQNYDRNERGELEIFRSGKKAWPNVGTGMGRAGDRRNGLFPWGGRRHLPVKPWLYTLPIADPAKWHTASRMALTLKMLQGKVMVVDKLALDAPTPAAFRALCERMRWDVKQDGGGILFMDGGSRLAPNKDFEPSFFYGSFADGRLKVVRPTLSVDDAYDWNKYGAHPDYHGPKGQKNPVPMNRFQIFDALEHHTLVITEGALALLEQEMMPVKVGLLPPHIRQQLPHLGALQHPLLGDAPENAAALSVQAEAAGRTEEAERGMYRGYYDDPYHPWGDEGKASYSVDGVEGVVRRSVPDGEGVGQWQRLD